jgi:hypothetical protein
VVTGIPPELIERAQEVLECKTTGKPIVPLHRRQGAGPSPDDQLLQFFASVDDWTIATDEMLDKFLAMARIGESSGSV